MLVKTQTEGGVSFFHGQKRAEANVFSAFLFQAAEGSSFLPNTLNEWLGAAGFLFLWASTVVGLLIKIVRQRDKLSTDVNGLGERLKLQEMSTAQREGRMQRVETEVREVVFAFGEGIKRLTRLEQITDGFDDHLDVVERRILGEIRGMSGAFNTELNGLREAVNTRDSTLRERVARLETYNRNSP